MYRKVNVKKRHSEYVRSENRFNHTLVDDGIAYFHEWGVDYEEFESGAGNYSTAIIERPNGSIASVEARLISFIEPLKDE